MSDEPILEFQKTLNAVFGNCQPLFSVSQKTTGNNTSTIAEPAPDLSIEDFAKTLAHCMNCRMHIGRGQICFGRGNPQAKIWFVGDFPSLDDDKLGTVFSADVGDLLQKMISAMKLHTEEVYFANLFKCRRPEGLKITETEIQSCAKFFEQQWAYGKPEILVALGEIPARSFSRSEMPLHALRGQDDHHWKTSQLFCTHHPRDLLQNTSLKKECWTDLQKVMKALGRL